MSHRVILSGYFGFNNAGDEAVLAALVQILRERFADLEIVALSADPELTARTLDIRAIDRWDKAAIRRELKGAALFCSGGGSLLQDVTSVRSVYYYTALIRLAQKMGVPTMVLAQGLGPLNTWLGKRLTINALRGCEILSWRDEKALNLAAELGLGGEQNFRVCDPVLLWREELPVPTNDAVTIALRPWVGLKLEEAARLVRALQEAGERVQLLPFYYGGEKLGEDEILAQELNKLLGEAAVEIVSCKSPAEVYRVIAASKLVVGMRLHSLIMAAAANVPAVAISYDPKVEAFAEQMGIEVAAGGVGFAAEELASLVLSCLELPCSYPGASVARQLWQPLLDEMAEFLA